VNRSKVINPHCMESLPRHRSKVRDSGFHRVSHYKDIHSLSALQQFPELQRDSTRSSERLPKAHQFCVSRPFPREQAFPTSMVIRDIEVMTDDFHPFLDLLHNTSEGFLESFRLQIPALKVEGLCSGSLHFFTDLFDCSGRLSGAGLQ